MEAFLVRREWWYLSQRTVSTNGDQRTVAAFRRFRARCVRSTAINGRLDEANCEAFSIERRLRASQSPGTFEHRPAVSDFFGARHACAKRNGAGRFWFECAYTSLQPLGRRVQQTQLEPSDAISNCRHKRRDQADFAWRGRLCCGGS